MSLDAKLPKGPLADKWTNHKNKINLVNPANKRNIDVIVVGTGLAGGSAAATLAELGYNVKTFVTRIRLVARIPLPRKGESMLQNYQGDGDSVYRLFYDTIKGRLPFPVKKMYRLAEVSANIIDQCVAQGVPLLENMVDCWTTVRLGAYWFPELFMRKDRRGNRLLLGAYSAMNRQINRGKSKPSIVMKCWIWWLLMARRVASLPAIWSQANLNAIQHTPWWSPLEVTEMCFTFLPTPWEQRNSFLENPQARSLFCQSVLYPNSPNLHSGFGDHQSKLTLMSSRWGMMVVFGFPKIRRCQSHPWWMEKLKEDRDYLEHYPSLNLVPRDVASRWQRNDAGFCRVNKTGEEFIRLSSAIMRYGKTSVIHHMKTQRKFKSVNWAKKWSKQILGICSRCTKRLSTKTHTKPRWWFTQLFTIPWGHLGGLQSHDHHPGCYAAGEANFQRPQGQQV